jgi:hypothetical protein
MGSAYSCACVGSESDPRRSEAEKDKTASRESTSFNEEAVKEKRITITELTASKQVRAASIEQLVSPLRIKSKDDFFTMQSPSYRCESVHNPNPLS